MLMLDRDLLSFCAKRRIFRFRHKQILSEAKNDMTHNSCRNMSNNLLTTVADAPVKSNKQTRTAVYY